MGDIGRPIRTIEFEPIEHPNPVREPSAPSPAPAPAPAEEPVPA